MFPRSSTFARRAAVALACGVGAATVIGLFAGNARTVPAGSEAVVMAFGRIRRVQNAGLVVAWPAPAGRIVLVPSENRPVTTSLAVPGLSLTGDGGAVRISANVAWRVADARAYATAGLDAAPVLQRVFEATAVEIAAGRSGDALLGAAHGGTETASSRALNTTMTTALNRRLLALGATGTAPGIEVMSADVRVTLPDAADADARPTASADLAAARAQAAQTRQAAAQQRESLLAAAHAAMEERIAAARVATATITALEGPMTAGSHAAMLEQLYHERIGAILNRAGSISTVDAKSVSKLILPGAQ